MINIIKTLSGFLLAAFTSTVFAHEVAITMDNPNTRNTILVSHKGIDKSILAALKKHHIKTILFVQGEQVDSKDGRALLDRWKAAGHLFGNHTYSHQSLNQISEPAYESDVLRNESFLLPYTNFKKIFRFPFLKEGNTASKRDAYRSFMREHEYVNGSVTIDASDWYINQRLEEKLAKNPNADLNTYKKYYLDHIWNRAQYYDAMAQEVLGRSPKHVLIVHHNLLNALFLDDVIQMFKNKGWHVIDADEAFKDPVFERTPDIVPAGESLIWALAKQTGHYDNVLRYPGEDESYEKPMMDKLDL